MASFNRTPPASIEEEFSASLLYFEMFHCKRLTRPQVETLAVDVKKEESLDEMLDSDKEANADILSIDTDAGTLAENDHSADGLWLAPSLGESVISSSDALRLPASVHDSVYDGVSHSTRRRSNPYRGLHRPLCSRHQWHDSDTLLSHRLPFSARQSVAHAGGAWLSPRGAQYCSASHHPHRPATRQISGSSIATVAHAAWHVGVLRALQYSIDGHQLQIWLALQLGCSTDAA